MKKILVLFLIIISSLVCVINAQTNYPFNCPILPPEEGAAFSQTGGRYKPASNLPGQYFRVLFVFVQFEGDNRPDASWNR